MRSISSAVSSKQSPHRIKKIGYMPFRFIENDEADDMPLFAFGEMITEREDDVQPSQLFSNNDYANTEADEKSQADKHNAHERKRRALEFTPLHKTGDIESGNPYRVRSSSYYFSLRNATIQHEQDGEHDQLNELEQHLHTKKPVKDRQDKQQHHKHKQYKHSDALIDQSAKRPVVNKQQSETVKNVNMPAAKLVKRSGKTYRFETFPVTMGRSKQCEMPVGGTGVSRKHAQLTYDVANDLFLLSDLESLNGIEVNGEKVASAVLEPGDQIKLGEARLVFYREEGVEPSQQSGNDPEAPSFYDADDAGSNLEGDPLDDLDLLLEETHYSEGDSLNEDLKSDVLKGGNAKSLPPVPVGQKGKKGKEESQNSSQGLMIVLSITALILFSAACFFAYQLVFSPMSASSDVAQIEPPSPMGMGEQQADQDPNEQLSPSAPYTSNMPAADPGFPDGSVQNGLNPPRQGSSSGEAPNLNDSPLSAYQPALGDKNLSKGDLAGTFGPKQPLLSTELMELPKQKSTRSRPKPKPKPAAARPSSTRSSSSSSAPTQRSSSSASAQPAAATGGSSSDIERRSHELTKQAESRYVSGYGSKLIKEVETLLGHRSLSTNSQINLQQIYERYFPLLDQYKRGDQAYKQGDKQTAFSTWASFKRLERDVIGEKESYYSREVNKKVVKEYLLRASKAQKEGVHHEAYRLWLKADKIDETGQARRSLASVASRAEAMFDEAVKLEQANINESIRLWQQVIALIPPGVDVHTKASAKLTWYQQFSQ